MHAETSAAANLSKEQEAQRAAEAKSDAAKAVDKAAENGATALCIAAEEGYQCIL